MSSNSFIKRQITITIDVPIKVDSYFVNSKLEDWNFTSFCRATTTTEPLTHESWNENLKFIVATLTECGHNISTMRTDNKPSCGKRKSNSKHPENLARKSFLGTESSWINMSTPTVLGIDKKPLVNTLLKGFQDHVDEHHKRDAFNNWTKQYCLENISDDLPRLAKLKDEISGVEGTDDDLIDNFLKDSFSEMWDDHELHYAWSAVDHFLRLWRATIPVEKNFKSGMEGWFISFVFSPLFSIFHTTKTTFLMSEMKGSTSQTKYRYDGVLRYDPLNLDIMVMEAKPRGVKSTHDVEKLGSTLAENLRIMKNRFSELRREDMRTYGVFFQGYNCTLIECIFVDRSPGEEDGEVPLVYYCKTFQLAKSFDTAHFLPASLEHFIAFWRRVEVTLRYILIAKRSQDLVQPSNGGNSFLK